MDETALVKADLPPTTPPPSSPNLDSLKDGVVQYLSQQTEGRTAVEVARSVGLPNKKSINPILYKLKNAQMLEVESAPGRKPLWRLSDSACLRMNEGLFRDSSEDSEALGAYSPKNHSRAASAHPERQQPHTLHRSHPKPYDTGAHGHHSRHSYDSASGPSSATPPCAPASQDPCSLSALSLVEDSEESRSDRHGREETLVKVVNDSGEAAVACSHPPHPSAHSSRDRTVMWVAHNKCMHCIYAENHHTEKKCSSLKRSFDIRFSLVSGGDEDKADVDQESEGYVTLDSEPPNMAEAERFKDMMGDLMFSNMTYVDEASMPEEDVLLPNEVVLLKLSVEPKQTATASRLAGILDKSEEDITYILGNCGNRVAVHNNMWSLTEEGAEWARRRFEAFPSLIHHLSPSDNSSSCTQHSSEFSQVREHWKSQGK